MHYASFLLLFVTASVQAHMQLNYPPPFNASNNPHTTGPSDPYLQYPYNCCGRRTPFPCRGYLSLLGTPAGAPVVTWPAGSSQTWNIRGIGNHWGGSCQVGFSIDKGKTFQVATSYEGNCPHRNSGHGPGGQDFDFTVPEDIPVGDAVFAWTWVNREQEFNMNCAAVTIAAPETEDTPDVSTPPASSTSSAAGEAATGTLRACTCTCESAAIASDPSMIHGEGCTCTCPNLSSASSFLKHRQVAQHQHGHGRVWRGLPPSTEHKRRRVAYSERPAMFVGSVNKGCLTPHTTAELKYPDPGPDVVPGDGVYPLELPTPADACEY